MRSIALCKTGIVAATLLVPAVAEAQAATTRTVSVCVLSGGALRVVSATSDTRTNDTLVTVATGPVHFRAVYPNHSSYAAEHAWYFNNHALLHRGRKYAKYGLPRVLDLFEIVRLNSAVGTVPLFVEQGTINLPEVLYIPVRVGCEFQPYQLLPEEAPTP